MEKTSINEIKKRKFVKELIKCDGNQVKAYQRLHPRATEGTARIGSYKLMKSDEVKRYLSEVLDEQGIKLITLNKKLYDLIKGPTKQILDRDGGIVDIKDNPTQLEAIKLGYKLHGVAEGGDKTVIDARSITINSGDADVSKSLERVSEVLLRINNSLLESPRELSGEIEKGLND